MLQRIGLGGLGILVAIMYWLGEALLHTFVFGHDSFFNNLISSDANEDWMRFLTVAVIVAFGFYAQGMVRRMRVLQMKLQKRGERLQSIIDHSYDAYIGMDKKGRINGWNRRAEGMFGWPRHKMIGRQMDTIMPERLRDLHHKGMQKYQQEHIGSWLYKPVRTQGLHREGYEFAIEMVVTPLQMDGEEEFFAFIRLAE